MEAMRANKFMVKEYLSTQQLVDCDSTNGGCNGGDFYYASEYAKSKGIVRDKEYRYTAFKGTCKYSTFMITTKTLFQTLMLLPD